MYKVVMVIVVKARPSGPKTVYVMTTSDTVGVGVVSETSVPPEETVVVMVTTDTGVGEGFKGTTEAASVAVMVRTVGVAPGSPGKVTVIIVEPTPAGTETEGAEDIADT